MMWPNDPGPDNTVASNATKGPAMSDNDNPRSDCTCPVTPLRGCAWNPNCKVHTVNPYAQPAMTTPEGKARYGIGEHNPKCITKNGEPWRFALTPHDANVLAYELNTLAAREREVERLTTRLTRAEAVCNAYDLYRTKDVRMKDVDEAWDTWKGLNDE